MFTLILRITLWCLDKFLRPVLWAEGKVYHAWESRQEHGKHAADPADWVAELPAERNELRADERDWFEYTPPVHNATCPFCGSDEFPLTTYDNQRMCPVCKDEAIITDRTFGHTVPAIPAIVDGLSKLTHGTYRADLVYAGDDPLA